MVIVWKVICSESIRKKIGAQGFILLLPQTAVLPRPDDDSDGVKQASGFVIPNRQTSCSMWCPMYGALQIITKYLFYYVSFCYSGVRKSLLWGRWFASQKHISYKWSGYGRKTFSKLHSKLKKLITVLEHFAVA